MPLNNETWLDYLHAYPDFASILAEPDSPMNVFSKHQRLQPWYLHAARHFGFSI